MKVALLFTALLLSPTNPGKALVAEDLFGSWSTTSAITPAEVTQVFFGEDGSVRLLRRFTDSPTQNLVALPSQVQRIDDLIVINFNHNAELRYRLVLSGWKTRDTGKLFGTLFLYSDGAVFNG